MRFCLKRTETGISLNEKKRNKIHFNQLREPKIKNKMLRQTEIGGGMAPGNILP